MNQRDKKRIVKQALQVKASEIGPRIDAIARNKEHFFTNKMERFDIIILIETLLCKTEAEIDAIARQHSTTLIAILFRMMKAEIDAIAKPIVTWDQLGAQMRIDIINRFTL